MNLIDDWLESNMKSKEIKENFNKALDFYNKKLGTKVLDYNLELAFNNKKRQGGALGTFSPSETKIEIFQLKQSIQEGSLDLVIVHELAHFLDRINRSKFSRYNFASSIRVSKERVIAEAFRSKMKPVPEKRTNYRGQTCEIFARAIRILCDNYGQ